MDTPLERPLVLFDGRCGFCKIWVEYARRVTQGAADYAPAAERAREFPSIPDEAYARSVQLLLPGGERLEGARAAFTLLALAPGKGCLLRLYESVPGFAPAAESAYRVIAAHRNLFAWLTRVAFGPQVVPLSYERVHAVFLRLLGLSYFCAFVSLGLQIRGLVGAEGIIPAQRLLRAASQALGHAAWWRLPYLFWLNASDTALEVACWLGASVAVAVIAGMRHRTALAALYVLYLSLSSIGQDFLSFQWDALLLEAGFLALVFGQTRLAVWMYRWLLFRLMFLSGSVKLLSHDPNWRNLTALSYHYWTQPLPTPVAWYLANLPATMHRISTAFVFFVELAVPFFIFAPRRLRWVGAGLIAVLQLLILISGNYAFFNLLTLSLCLFCFDDGMLRAERSVTVRRSPAGLRLVAAVIVLLSLGGMSETFFHAEPAGLGAVERLVGPFQIANTYGLFAVMTTERIEIQIQGSDDGLSWKDYVLPYKPGPLGRRPAWVAPYQPRLDWQMWFAALGNWRENPWFVSLMKRILDGRKPVLALFAQNPFPRAPPRYVRALAFEYRFTTPAERRATGNWWKRTPRGEYLQPISLESFERPSE
jgi:predicted DCC family thiol-disulfide oxidoreductase YuxK